MSFKLLETRKVRETVERLSMRDKKKHKKILRCLAKLESDPNHPGLASHPYESIKGPLGEKIWESYVENRTPSAWRVWWYYGPDDGQITLVDLGPHP